MRIIVLPAVILLGTLARGQNIFTIAGIPYTHRDSLDSQAALSAPLNSVYGLLIDRLTGRLIFNDEALVLRYEPDRTLLALAGNGATQYPSTTVPSPLASMLNVEVLRGMAQDVKGNLYLSDAGFGRVYRVALDGTVTTFAGGGTNPPGPQSDGLPATSAI